MGRRKSKPHRAGGIILDPDASAETELNKQNVVEGGEEAKGSSGGIDKPYFVEVVRLDWLSGEHLDISEVIGLCYPILIFIWSLQEELPLTMRKHIQCCYLVFLMDLMKVLPVFSTWQV
ncbi:hypothetical protein V8G54_036467 [Vigna mungo]|uniref:Uncharacterized protein n=1 Tax=Vigna mungo TaxID=3915 RepID=A0AAQ3MHQ2_VIGMU